MGLLEGDAFKSMNNIRFILSRYNRFMNLFNEEFEKAKKDSIFEFSLVSCVIIEREDYLKFEYEKEKCENRVERILYHGTGIEPITGILTGLFRRSEERCYQHGKGVYSTDSLDTCWFYGGKVNNRANGNKIPPIGEEFSLITCAIYYNKKGFKRVYDYKYTPQKN